MGYVYRWTNNVNGKMYIGSHNGSNPKYIGSGICFVNAIKKYGVENFTKEILYSGDNFREEEERLLNFYDAAGSALYYNLKNEALGGTFYGVANGMFGKKHTNEAKIKIGNSFRGIKRPDHSIKMSGNKNPMYGKNEHTTNLVKKSKENLGKTFEEIHGIEKAEKLKLKLSLSQTGKKHLLKILICDICGLEGSGPNMTRFHFAKCNAVSCVGCKKLLSMSELKSRHSKCFKNKFKQKV